MLFSTRLIYHWHLHLAVSNLKAGISWPQSKYLAHKLLGSTNLTECVLILFLFDITVFRIRLCRHIKPDTLHQSQTFVFLCVLQPNRSLMMVWTGQAWALLNLGEFAKGRSLAPFLSVLKKKPTKPQWKPRSRGLQMRYRDKEFPCAVMDFGTTQTFCNTVSHNGWDFIRHPTQPQCDGLKGNTNSHYTHSTALKMSLFPYRSGVFPATFFIIMFIISINFHF